MHSAGGIAAAVRSGSTTASYTVGDALARIAAADPLTSGIDVVRPEAIDEAAALDARISAGESPGPLAGVPVAVKAETAVAGLVTTYGGRANRQVATQDAETVRRFRAAGAVVVATTHMSEFGQFPFTEGDWGAVGNPADPTRSVGGSSGGSAAAVASGLVPIALGGDGGGSVRIPASCCGIVGLKPRRGRISTAPHPDLWGALGVHGPLARSVADVTLALDVLTSTTAVDRFTAPPLASTVASSDAAGLRVGVVVRTPSPLIGVDPQVVALTRRVADVLTELGHEVSELPHRWPNVRQSFGPQFFAAIAHDVGLVTDPALLEPRTLETARLYRSGLVGSQRYGERLGERYRARIERLFSAYDVLLTPTLACLPPPVGQLRGAGSVQGMWRAGPMIAFTTLANVTGHPALSLPAGRSREGWPVGVQLVTFRHDEALLLAVGARLERAGLT